MSNILYKFIDRYLQNSFVDEISSIINKEEDKTSVSKQKVINILDVGCYLGNFSRQIRNNLNSNIKGNFYLFDPNPNLKIKDFHYECLGISDKKSKQIYFFNTYFPSSGSGFDETTKNDFLWNLSRKIITLSIFKSFIKLSASTTTLDSICAKKNISSIEILKIDTEGHEFNVLKGGVKALEKTKIIQIEILSKKNLFDQKFFNINKFLINKNFTLYKKKNLTSVSIFSNIKAIDALYVKNSLSK